MFRLTSLAVAALLGSAALAMAQQPNYSPVNPNRYTAQQPANTGTMPERKTYSNWRQTMTPSRETRMPTRATMNANQFSTQAGGRRATPRARLRFEQQPVRVWHESVLIWPQRAGRVAARPRFRDVLRS